MEREQQRLKVKTLLLCCALCKFHVTDVQNMHDQIMSDRRSKHLWSNCIMCIPFILSGSPNESWLHTCNPCVITTWRLGLWAPLVAHYDNEHWNAVSVTSKGPWHWGHNNELDLLSTEGFIIKFRAELFIAGLR